MAHPTIRTSLGAYLRELRSSRRDERGRRLSQSEVARRCADVDGLTQTNLSKFEIGERMPDVRQLEAVMRALGAGDAERAEAVRRAGT